MTSRTTAIVLVALLAASGALRAQDCSTALDRAAKRYEQGEFDTLIQTLAPCLKNGMSEEDTWQGWRLVALANLFLDRPESADSAIANMLAINPRYQPNPGRDPMEFIRPLQRFGSYPRFLAGLKAGLVRSGREVTRTYSVVGNDASSDESSFTVGSDIGAVVDLNVTPTIGISTEALYATRLFKYTRRDYLTIDQAYTEHLTYLTLPLIVKYRIGDWSTEPYVYCGYYLALLLGATSDLEAVPGAGAANTLEFNGSQGRKFTDNGIRTVEDRRNTFNHGLTLGAGVVYKIGDGAVVLDVRYSHGLASVVRPETRYADQDLLYKYLYVDDDFRLRDLSLSIGYVFQLSFSSYRK